MSAYRKLADRLRAEPKTWAITGVAGFIGSNLLETLLKLGQKVIGFDNLATGHRHNLDDVRKLLTPEQWRNFTFIEGDICNLDECRVACAGTDYVLHQAALASVPRSLADPVATNASNVTGFLNMLVAARDARVRRFVYAASSSTYGDHLGLPKTEDQIGKPLSPYAVSKLVNEIYADVFSRCYDMEQIGLRYFNVFGPRQDPQGAYAAVIPAWFRSLIRNEPVYINGDGETSRDFCFVENAVQANLLAATTATPEAINRIYNVAVGERCTLNELYGHLQHILAPTHPHAGMAQPVYRDFRAGDVHHSLADIGKARRLLGYEPAIHMANGLALTATWYLRAHCLG